MIRLRERLAAVMHAEVADEQVTGERFQRLAQVVYETLPAGVDFQALLDSLRAVTGMWPTKAQLRDLAHRLAGNVPDLKARRAVPAWAVQRHYEWVPLTVTRVRRAKNASGKIGVTVTFKVMAGSACPLLIERFWSSKQCAYFARHMGFSRPPAPNAKYPPRYPYLAPEEFTTLRLYGLLDPKLSGAEPVFEKVRFPPSVLAFNKEQLKYRARGRGYECPKRFPLTVRCHRCPIGYEACRVGCHAKTYVTQDCPLCKQAAPFDPEQKSPYCVNCTTKAVYAKE